MIRRFYRVKCIGDGYRKCQFDSFDDVKKFISEHVLTDPNFGYLRIKRYDKEVKEK